MCFGSHVSAAANEGISNGQFIEDTVEPPCLPETNSLFIMCTGIIRNKSFVREWARAEARTSDLGHRARHAILHMAAECADHSVT